MLSATCWSCLGGRGRIGRTDWEETLMDSNSLYYGDNLDILRRFGQDESVDLV